MRKEEKRRKGTRWREEVRESQKNKRGEGRGRVQEPKKTTVYIWESRERRKCWERPMKKEEKTREEKKRGRPKNEKRTKKKTRKRKEQIKR